MRRWRRAGIALGLVALLTGCDDDPVQVPDAGATVDDLETLEEGIHAVLSVPGLASWAQGQPTTIRLHLKAVGVEGRLQSYQGELRFDPERITIRDALFPEGFLGAWNVVEAGVMRFAGVTLEGVDLQPVVELTVSSSGRPTATDFEVVLEELVGSGPDGGFRDLTPKVILRRNPLLVGGHVGPEQPRGD